MQNGQQEVSAAAKSCRAASELHVKPVLTTIKGTRTITGLGNTSIWALIKANELRVVKFGRRTMVVVESIHEMIARKAGSKREAL
jgi:hypothetical protein